MGGSSSTKRRAHRVITSDDSDSITTTRATTIQAALPEWQAAIEALMLVADLGGTCTPGLPSCGR
jgi:hypothetical protein